MIEIVDGYSKDCLRLPGQLKKWLTYTKLKTEIDDMIELLPLVEGLAKDSIRPRHWEEVIELTGTQIPFESETFVLKQLFDANLLKIKEEIEDISENADKQLKLEKQLRDEISAYYETRELTVAPIAGLPSIISGDISDIQTEIEDHIN
jgi:dynein heavy chain